jgi:hypothetical protein
MGKGICANHCLPPRPNIRHPSYRRWLRLLVLLRIHGLAAAHGASGITAPPALHTIGTAVLPVAGLVLGTKDKAVGGFLKTHSVQMNECLLS